MFLEILQNLQENACARVSFLIKLQVWTPFLQIISGRLLLEDNKVTKYGPSWLQTEIKYFLASLITSNLSQITSHISDSFVSNNYKASSPNFIKNDEKCFVINLKSFFCSQDI